MTEKLAVSADQLKSVGKHLVTIADHAQRDIRSNGGAQDGDAAANTSFAVAQALAQCEDTWSEALAGVATKIAVAGDNLELNARTYAEAEAAAQGGFQPR
ncbi:MULTISPECIES: hypothetical protein [unclassified Crossiella]|uniref:hypothetical protein n=1 Tax=unclassified Crossiella TaxID=2620835 RepID=UPI001FFFE56A|nr:MULTISPECIES: hypothetical protein [unclassified Crossiella]MCK2238974.1 hypothetical protein [Crossiella sp. S99.2]MCK2251457.1 hypothetical protein [Crossiella sp. S99.1]